MTSNIIYHGAVRGEHGEIIKGDLGVQYGYGIVFGDTQFKNPDRMLRNPYFINGKWLRDTEGHVINLLNHREDGASITPCGFVGLLNSNQYGFFMHYSGSFETQYVILAQRKLRDKQFQPIANLGYMQNIYPLRNRDNNKIWIFRTDDGAAHLSEAATADLGDVKKYQPVKEGLFPCAPNCGISFMFDIISGQYIAAWAEQSNRIILRTAQNPAGEWSQPLLVMEGGIDWLEGRIYGAYLNSTRTNENEDEIRMIVSREDLYCCVDLGVKRSLIFK